MRHCRKDQILLLLLKSISRRGHMGRREDKAGGWLWRSKLWGESPFGINGKMRCRLKLIYQTKQIWTIFMKNELESVQAGPGMQGGPQCKQMWSTRYRSSIQSLFNHYCLLIDLVIGDWGLREAPSERRPNHLGIALGVKPCTDGLEHCFSIFEWAFVRLYLGGQNALKLYSCPTI